MLTKIGERLAVKIRDDCSEEFTVEELDDGLSRITVKRSPDNASSWCWTQQFKFPGMTELDVVDEDDTVDDFDELDAGAAARITIVCDGLSQGNFLLSRDGASHVHSLHFGVSVRSWTSFPPRLPAWRERKEGCRFIVAKVRVQTVIGSKWSSAAVMFPSVATVSSSMRPQS